MESVARTGRPRYQLFRTEDRFCWRLLSGNGQTLVSKSYGSRRARTAGLKNFRAAAGTVIMEDFV